jgi:hypothetical protein
MVLTLSFTTVFTRFLLQMCPFGVWLPGRHHPSLFLSLSLSQQLSQGILTPGSINVAAAAAECEIPAAAAAPRIGGEGALLAVETCVSAAARMLYSEEEEVNPAAAAAAGPKVSHYNTGLQN